jgi:acetaldehyde dehydrogenase
MQIGIVGSGNIGTDLLLKLHKHPELSLVGVAGIDPDSEGLALARDLGYLATAAGLEDLLDQAPDLDLVFDATSASAHASHARLLAELDVRSVDLTPAALGSAVGAQATVPIVAALAEVAEVTYAEIVSTVSARSAGPGTRANIDEFTIATARSLETIGSAGRGKAIIVLNPADPPITMRNAVYARLGGGDPESVADAVRRRVAAVARYVPGYRLVREPVVEDERMVVLLEVEGAGDFLPPYAGNLDIMTSAAIRVAEVLAETVAPA